MSRLPRSLQRNGFKVTSHARALGFLKDARGAAQADRTDDAINLLKNALSHLADSHDLNAPATRREVEAELAKLTGENPESPALARTTPDDGHEVLAAMLDQRRPDVRVIEQADAENAAKKVGGQR